ncbi:hypothetical protein ACMU_00390 [Actibacterium mucosum KCTC 23349]|uniref:N-acetyltransferase domain-containing protein n=1 Tax=Actibacterium mucosum KCTC 23349 TaxID=1454373 RepID=A0A037ZLL5_9RHOB|nr:GNAT family N-acetyltransferase [Actibacterium mucosum]KAJ56984.1 hypothetical protein ACMU_00390 [Actibacterium mucosum KCTC 23349]
MTDRALYDSIAATWPAAQVRSLGPWTLRDGAGAGNRVSATTATGDVTARDIDQAEAAGSNLFMLRPWEGALDAELDARGYALKDPTLLMTAPVDRVTPPRPAPFGAFTIWPPMESQIEVWEAGGIGPERRAVMDRVTTPKTAIMGRAGNRVAGAAFAAIDRDTAMIHAVEVTQDSRRQGVAHKMMGRAAIWAQDEGASTFAILVTRQNTAARALYASLGLTVVGHYHYRFKATP